ncbi:RNA helicase required for poly(A+) mRNA export [Mitosporidium daphniae]
MDNSTSASTSEAIAARIAKMTAEKQNAEMSDSNKFTDDIVKVGDVASLLQTVSGKVSVQLADQQADVNSPLYSASSFEELGLPAELLKGIYAMNYNRPSKVQEKALPILLRTKGNLIAQSQSGTGKTAAFALTMLEQINPSLEGVTQALCLSPSRELARQIEDVVLKMAKFTTITIGTALREGNLDEAVNRQIVIGTPGTVLELIRRRMLDLSQLRVLVFDEADVMLDKQNLGTQSVRVKAACPSTVQTLLFSATFKPEVMAFASRVVPNPNILSLKKEELSIDAITEFYMKCENSKHRLQMLAAIYGLLSMSQSIIFVATRNAAEEVQAWMTLEGHQTAVLHGGMDSDARDAIIDEFRAGRSRVLIATNVLARGIDIPQVSLVINYDLPETADRKVDPETYLHRIGRTGRFGRSGIAINMVHDAHSFDILMAIRTFFNKPMKEIPTNDVSAIDESLNSA